MLYRVRIGQDDYLGTPEEVVGFMARAEGAPSRDPRGYMEGVARRLAEQLGVAGIPTDDAGAFLDALGERGVIRVDRQGEPSDERADPDTILDSGPLTFGRGVEAEDLP